MLLHHLNHCFQRFCHSCKNGFLFFSVFIIIPLFLYAFAYLAFPFVSSFINTFWHLLTPLPIYSFPQTRIMFLVASGKSNANVEFNQLPQNKLLSVATALFVLILIISTKIALTNKLFIAHSKTLPWHGGMSAQSIRIKLTACIADIYPA